MALGQPADLGQGGLAVAHSFQTVVPGAAAPAQDGRARPDAVQPGAVVVEQGEGAGGVDGARLKPGGVDGVQHLVEPLQLVGALRVPHPHGVELGVDALQGHVGQGAVGQQNLLRLADQKAAKAHTRVHLDVGAGHGGPVFCQGVEGQAGVHRGDGAHHVQVHQLLQLLPVGGGAEHEDLFVLKAGLAQLLRLLHLVHGKAADALRPEELGHGDDARPSAVASEDAVDDRPCGPLFDDGQVVLDRGPLDDQLAHKDSPLLSLWECGMCVCEIPIHSILPLPGKNSNGSRRDGRAND